MGHYQPHTETYYDPQKDPQFEGLSFHEIVAKGKPRVLGVSWEEALAREIPANATFVGNLTWPQNGYDDENFEKVERNIATHLVGPPGDKRDRLKSEQGDYGRNRDQVGFYYVFKKDMPAPEQP